MRRHTSRRLLVGTVTSAAVTAGCLALTPAAAGAQGSGIAPHTDRQAQFAAAAAEFHVPESVLLGVSFQESAWEAHRGHYSTAGGYGPMNLTDVTAGMVASGGSGAGGRADLDGLLADPALHTLPVAARLTGSSAERLRTSERDNIRGGAALLASYEKSLTGSTPADPADWYGAVARYAQSPDRKAAGVFADRVYAVLRAGMQRQTGDGQRMKLAADPALHPATGLLAALHLRAAPTTHTECPATVDCRFVAAAPANGQVADRPADGMNVKYIVIHDTESSYDSAVSAFQKADGAAAHYVMRASDGAVTQMVPGKDLAFHAGNYWFNMHSIGIEHEGFAAQGATWYTQTQYRATADLVAYLARRYDVPLDREHIIGHDNVPGPLDHSVAGMHWDPGPSWDWSAFMGMLSATPRAASPGVGPVGSVVTITPGFSGNRQAVRVCPADDPTGSTRACTTRTQAANFLPVRTGPSTTAPLFADPAIHPGGTAGTTEVNDWGSTVQDGQQYVVAGRSGDWTAIWFSGTKVWFHNPGGANTTIATGVRVVRAAGTSAVPVFGLGYPQPSEYPAGLTPSAEQPLSIYSLPAGQAYVATQPAVRTDDYFTKGGRVVTGTGKLYTIQYNHRVVLVNAADVSCDDAS
ncbi:N-acetylmuramoyl-L-alanine amidase [Streptomyces sp. NPDC051322]|uniref:N-acetylmuramoyl-L-alanine amidase n=1 Tax=Streptomyces sp. NPDC051322 TaxID=3154645 RepID=UPI00344CFBDB